MTSPYDLAPRTYRQADVASDQEWSVILGKELFPGRIQRHADTDGARFRIRRMVNGCKFVDMETAREQVQHDAVDTQAVAEDALIVFVAHEGSGRASQGDRDFDFNTGDIVFRRAGLPSQAVFSKPCRISLLWIPVKELRTVLPAAFDLAPARVDALSPLADIVRRTADVMSARMDETAECIGNTLGRALVQLTMSAYLDTVQQTGSVSSTEFQWQRCINHLDQHLCDPDLSASACAAALGISLRYFFRLLETHGLGFRSYIQEQRLIRVRQVLERSAGQRVNLAAVAFQHGFNDASHFSQAFRRHFGMAPRDFLASLQAKTI